MKFTLLHIGPHKTGTSYLQACFSHYREALRAQGVVVPVGWDHAPGNPSHTGLVAALREGGDLSGAAEVLAQSGGAEVLLISAEDLAGLDEGALHRLRTLLGDSDVSIIYYIRRWSDMLPSEWQELVKQGHSLSFPEYMVRHLRNPETSHLFNLDIRLKKFQDVFGQDSIRLVCYSVLRDAGVDLFVHFCKHFLGWWRAEVLPGSAEFNPSRLPVQIELLRVLNALEFARTGNRSAGLRGRLYAAWSSLNLDTVVGAIESCQTTMLFSDAFPALLAMHRASHERYRTSIVKPQLKDLFFRPVRREIPYFVADYLLKPGVVESIHQIYDALTPPPNEI